MVKNTILAISLLLVSFTFSSAQELSYGFKAGLNFSTFNTEDIEQFDGQDVESFRQNSGFHLGVIISTEFSEIFGAGAEILFSQKGGSYDYDGPSYTELNSFLGEDRVTRNGFRNMSLNTSNSYLDIPLMVYVRPVKWLELSAGVNVAFLISSTATGELTFREVTQAEEDAYGGISLDYKYYSDEPGQADMNDDSEIRVINGLSLELPKTLNAYYDYPDGAETGLYSRFDFGVHAGAKFFINKSLFIGGRFNLGLADVTRSDVDRSLLEKDADNNLIYRDDKDVNMSIQASIGFSF